MQTVSASFRLWTHSLTHLGRIMRIHHHQPTLPSAPLLSQPSNSQQLIKSGLLPIPKMQGGKELPMADWSKCPTKPQSSTLTTATPAPNFVCCELLHLQDPLPALHRYLRCVCPRTTNSTRNPTPSLSFASLVALKSGFQLRSC